MATLRWTHEAEAWLRDIHEFIAVDNPKAAAAEVVQGIYEKAQILADFPDIGYRYDTPPEGEIRILLYGHHRITYLKKADEQIDILGVFHGALDINKYLK